ncbi:hypothetical protein F5X99DRAFT_425640 [Biscogniauxia marginata]|nr:hypothetical protein F5X99DRAFT_425640 [Biscogniauxia marginata]
MASFTESLHQENWSWTAIPLALLITLYPRLWSGIFGPGRRWYPAGTPRTFSQDLENQNVPPILRGRLQRAEAAMNNGIENIPLFVAGVIAANVEGLDLWTLNILCLSYLLVRVIYTWVYIYGQELQSLPALTRTVIWFIGTFIIGGLLLSSGPHIDPLEKNASYWFSTSIKVPNPAPQHNLL